MLRGVFSSPGVNQDAVNYYVDLFKKVEATPDWKDFTEKAAFKQTFMTGDKFKEWVADAAKTHHDLMEKAGFLAKKK
jgi:tripartite-type tricarboxylate transporter receptor subunit TctC